jgi:hypothetical protein
MVYELEDYVSINAIKYKLCFLKIIYANARKKEKKTAVILMVS